MHEPRNDWHIHDFDPGVERPMAQPTGEIVDKLSNLFPCTFLNIVRGEIARELKELWSRLLIASKTTFKLSLLFLVDRAKEVARPHVSPKKSPTMS